MERSKKAKKKEFDLDKFLEKELRRAFKRTPMYGDAKRRAKEEYFVPSKTGKPMRRVRYKCAKCGQAFLDKTGSREIAVDHIEPVVPLDRPLKDRGEYIDRLFCSVDNLQILCNYKGERNGIKSCHKIKTAEERALAATYRKEKDNNANDLHESL